MSHPTLTFPVCHWPIFVNRDLEQEEVVAPVSAPLPPRQKHYKIIFIKAPSAAPSYNTQVLQQYVAPQVEEKTLVYVLSKKPEAIPEELLTARQVQKIQPSKPEVYFIKYKAQQEQVVSAPSTTVSWIIWICRLRDLKQNTNRLPNTLQFNDAPQVVVGPTAQVVPIESGSDELSLPIEPRKPAEVYGPV